MDLSNYIVLSCLPFIAVLNLLGYAFKKIPKIPNWAIPILLLPLGIVLCFIPLGITGQAMIQGLLITALSVWGHQVIKQLTTLDLFVKNEYSDSEDQGLGPKMRILKKGMKGPDVTLLQQELAEADYNPGAQDGVFEKGTWAAVVEFQKTNQLKADGVVGLQTWNKLLSDDKTKGNQSVVYYSQGDPRWAAKMYSITGDKSQTIASSGCGPTSMAMVVATFVDKLITPFDMSTLAINLGFRTKETGTGWGFFPRAANQYGLKCIQTYNTDLVYKALLQGKIVIANMGKGYFTNKGHYIVLYKTDGQYFYAHDPASVLRVKALVSSFKKESKCYFIFSM